MTRFFRLFQGVKLNFLKIFFNTLEKRGFRLREIVCCNKRRLSVTILAG